MVLPNIDSCPVDYIKTGEEKIQMPIEIFQWLTIMVDTMNEALIQIDNRLTAGGL